MGNRSPARQVPSGTTDNSPAIYRWVNQFKIPISPGGAKESTMQCQRFLSSLTGLVPLPPENPALKRWAIVGCPAGTWIHENPPLIRVSSSAAHAARHESRRPQLPRLTRPPCFPICATHCDCSNGAEIRTPSLPRPGTKSWERAIREHAGVLLAKASGSEILKRIPNCMRKEESDY